MQKKTLKDGLRVLAIPHQETKTVTILCLLGVGARYEEDRVAGISHFLEHIVFKGTKNRPTTHKIASEIDSLGGIINAFTGKEYTGFWIKLAAEHCDKALDVVADLVQNPLLRASDIEKEKGVICEEINMYQDTPREYVHDLFEEVIFAGNSLGRSLIGSKETVRAITRADFESYQKKYYGADNAVVALAGKIDPSEIISKIDRAFDFNNKTAVKDYRAVELGADKSQVKILAKPTEQTHFILGVKGYSNNHPDKYISKVLGVMLAGGMSSRLFQEIREKRGLAYYVRGFSHSYRDAGYLMIQAGVDVGKLTEALKVILAEGARLCAKGPLPGELEKAKEFFKGNLFIQLEDSMELANFYAIKELVGDKVSSLEKVVKAVDKITKEDIFRVAKDLFQTQNLNLAAIGKIKNQNQIKSLLKI